MVTQLVRRDMLVGTDSLECILFSDEGDSLGSWNEGLTNLNVKALTFDNTGYVYASTGTSMMLNLVVWQRPLSEMLHQLKKNQIQIPAEF